MRRAFVSIRAHTHRWTVRREYTSRRLGRFDAGTNMHSRVTSPEDAQSREKKTFDLLSTQETFKSVDKEARVRPGGSWGLNSGREGG